MKEELVYGSTIKKDNLEYLVTKVVGEDIYIRAIVREDVEEELLTFDDWELTGEPLTNEDGTIREKFKKYLK